MGKKKFSGSPTLDKLAGLYFRWCPNCGAGKDYLIQKDGDMRCLECGFEWDPFDYYYDRNTKSYVRKDDSDDDCNDDDDDCSDDDRRDRFNRAVMAFLNDDNDCSDDDCGDDDDDCSDDDCGDDDDDCNDDDDDCSDDDRRDRFNRAVMAFLNDDNDCSDDDDDCGDDDDDCSDDDDDDCSDDDCRSKKMKHCPYCDSTNIRYAGDGRHWGDNEENIYKCIDCGEVFSVPTEDVND